MDNRAVPLSDISFDAGTQVRAAINEDVVTQYAERMTDGDVFPPVVLFHDGNRYYMGDGFHRAMAAQRNGLSEIPSDIRPGTKADALWFALGANKDHGARLTHKDKQHAVQIALEAWPNKLHREIAQHVGCSFSLVSKQSSRYTGVTGEKVPTGRELVNQQKRDAVIGLIQAGEKQADQIAAKAKVSQSFVSKVRAEMGLQCFDRSRAGVVKRRAQMREMAESGHTSIQIAAALGLSVDGCRETMRTEHIDAPADAVTRRTLRHDSNRIVDQMVMDAENLTADVALINFSELEAERIGDWLGSLAKSKQALSAFIRRLNEEHKKHVEAA